MRFEDRSRYTGVADQLEEALLFLKKLGGGGKGAGRPNSYRYLPAHQNSDSVVAQAFSASALTRAQRQEFCRPSRPLALDGDMSDEAAAAPDGARDPPAQLRALG